MIRLQYIKQKAGGNEKAAYPPAELEQMIANLPPQSLQLANDLSRVLGVNTLAWSTEAAPDQSPLTLGSTGSGKQVGPF